MSKNPFRDLPAVNEVLALPAIRALAEAHGHELTAFAVRRELDELRQRLAQGKLLDGQAAAEALAARVVSRIDREVAPKLR